MKGSLFICLRVQVALLHGSQCAYRWKCDCYQRKNAGKAVWELILLEVNVYVTSYVETGRLV